MKSGERVIQLAWLFLGLLAVAAAVIVLGRPSVQESPLSTSFDPGGAAALAELLRQEGYSIEVVDSIPIEPHKDVLPILFLSRQQITVSPDTSEKADDEDTGAKPKSNSSSNSNDDEMPSPKTKPGLPLQFVTNQMRAGGSALVLGYGSSEEITSVVPNISKVTDDYAHTYSISSPAPVSANGQNLSAADASFEAWHFEDKLPFANIDSLNGGRVIVIPQGEIAMNSYIDQGDNAKFLVDAIKLVAPAGKKLQIIDGSVIGAGRSGLIEALGPWAHGIELQTILLGLVIVYSLGKRFGIADETARFQPGARDLLNGIADTYSRGKAGKAALQQITQEADRNVRRYLKLSVDAPIRKRNEMLPESVARALSACEHAMAQDPEPEEAFELARRLETELEVFLSRRRSSANRRRRRVKSA